MDVNDKFVGVRIRALGTSVCVATHLTPSSPWTSIHLPFTASALARPS
jgi:hypothetical protein